MQANNCTTLNEDIGLEYVRNRTGTTMEGFYERGDRKTNVYMKPVQNLLVYMKTGSLSYYMRSKLSDFQCPEGFEEEYLLFQDAYEERHYAKATILPRVHSLRQTFAVCCLKKWVLSGMELMNVLPYLAAYMGHTDFRATQYYLRLTADLYPDLISRTEAEFGYVIPGGGGLYEGE